MSGHVDVMCIEINGFTDRQSIWEHSPERIKRMKHLIEKYPFIVRETRYDWRHAKGFQTIATGEYADLFEAIDGYHRHEPRTGYCLEILRRYLDKPAEVLHRKGHYPVQDESR